MTQYVRIHAGNPQARLLRQAVEVVRGGGVIVYPTDSCYALGCAIGDKNAQERIRRIRRVDRNHNFTLVCRDLSEIATYAKVDNSAYRMLKSFTPGAYTFILRATHEVPRRLQNPRRKTIGLRVPDHAGAQGLLEMLGEPLMSSTLIMPDEEMPLTDPEEMAGQLHGQVDLVLDAGQCGHEATTVVDLTDGVPVVRRHGLGDPAPFEH